MVHKTITTSKKFESMILKGKHVMESPKTNSIFFKLVPFYGINSRNFSTSNYFPQFFLALLCFRSQSQTDFLEMKFSPSTTDMRCDGRRQVIPAYIPRFSTTQTKTKKKKRKFLGFCMTSVGTGVGSGRVELVDVQLQNRLAQERRRKSAVQILDIV